MELTVKVTRYRSHLPEHVLSEIGRIVADWAVIETNIYMHTFHICGGKIKRSSSGAFSVVKEKWREVLLEAFPHASDRIERVHKRLNNRHQARSFAVHGNWRYVSDDDIAVHIMEFKKGRPLYYKAPITFAELQDQALYVAELKYDLLRLIADTAPHGPEVDRLIEECGNVFLPV